MASDQSTAYPPSDTLPPSVIRRRKRRRTLLAAGVLLAAGSGYYFFLRDRDQGPETQPLLATVEIGNIENTIASAGTLQPVEFVDVGVQVTGQLQKLHVEVGDLVEADQLLAEIDPRTQQSRVDATRANLQALEAQVRTREAEIKLARSNLERQESLREKNNASELDYDTAAFNLVSAESALVQLQKQIEQTRATLEGEEVDLGFTKIYAPITGTVVSIEMKEGRTVNAVQSAPTILRIADLSRMTVETQISEADIGNIKEGMDVYFTTLGSGDRRWSGKVRQILPTPVIDNNVVLYTGLFDVDNPDGALRTEMTAQVFFVTASAQNVLTVPMGALTFSDQLPGEGAGAAAIPEDMAARIAARRAAGGFPNGGPAGGFPGGQGGVPGGGSPSGSPGDGGGFTPGNFGGAFPGGGRRGGARLAGAGNSDAPARRLATVTVAKENGIQEQREVIVGVTSRVAAEVVSGLEAGEQVVAGILQPVTSTAEQQNENDPRAMFRMMRGFR